MPSAPAQSLRQSQEPAAPPPEYDYGKPAGSRPGAASLSSPAGSYLGRAEYIGGVVAIDEEDAKMYPQGHTSDTAELDMQYLQDLKAFDLPSRSLRESLILNYMEKCNPWMPVVEKTDMEGTGPSILLLQAIFVAGSRTSAAPQAQTHGATFYRRAKALFSANIEKNPLTIIQAICILQWWNPSGPEHISMDASSFWLHMGIALGHQFGLHREQHTKQANASRRRKLWWTLFTRDCMISVSHGRPRAICMKDCDVRRPTLDDFAEKNLDAHIFIAYVDICSILADITEAAVRGNLGRCRRLSIETRLSDWIKNLPTDLHLHDRQTGDLAPYNFKVRQLHVPYFTAMTVLYRPTMAGSNPSIAAFLSSSFIAGIYEDFLARGEVTMLAPVFIFHLLTSAIAQLPCYRYPALWAKAKAEFVIIDEALAELAKRYPTAFGAQRVLRDVRQAVRKEKQQEGLPQLSGTAEQLKFFTSFGPKLCSKWDFVYSPEAPVGPGKDLTANSAQSQLGGSLSQSDLLFPHTQNRNGQGLTEAWPITQHESHDASTPGSMVPPWASGLAELTYTDGTMPSAFAAGMQHRYSGDNIDSVGEWMISDWVIGQNWS
ncbi:hypothetical protein ACLOAV_000413 [Pseudogymnoascus australis]